MAAVLFGFAGMYWLRVDDATRSSPTQQSRWPWWALATAAASAKRLTLAGGVFIVLGIYLLFGG